MTKKFEILTSKKRNLKAVSKNPLFTDSESCSYETTATHDDPIDIPVIESVSYKRIAGWHHKQIHEP